MTQTATLARLKPGHEYPGASLNARTAGRDSNITELAASIKAEGVLQSLLVCPGPKGDSSLYVIAGNRRLAALRSLKWDADIPIILRQDVTPGSALAMSLAENITQCPMHPVDRFETFAAMVTAGKTEADIAAAFSISKHVVSQSLALGRLHPKIRQAWRDEKIDAACARAFTLSDDQAAQLAVFDRLSKRRSLWVNNIRHELAGNQQDVKRFLKIVGREAYEAAGGKVQVDLFAGTAAAEGEDEVEDDVGAMLVSDQPLLVRLAGEAIAKKCADLVASGWAWAEDADDLPEGATYQYSSIAWKRIAHPKHNAPKAEKAKAGCAVAVNYQGQWEITYGLIKPGTKIDAPAGKKGAKLAPKTNNKISNALLERLEEQLTHATKDALKAQADGASLGHLLAGIVASQIREHRPSHTASDVRNAFDKIRERLPAKDFNSAMERRFDVKGYFGSAPKVLVIQAITEMGHAAQAAKLKAAKAAAWKWAIANHKGTGWLPPQLRTTHYAGPGAKAAAKPKGKRK